MKTAFILPTSVLLSGKFVNTGYHLVLAPQALRSHQYADYYRTRGALHEEIFLDNGAWEGEVVEKETLVGIAKLVHAKVIVVPDVFQDSARTIERAHETLPWLTEQWPGELAVAPQGDTPQNWRRCVTHLCKEEFHYWAVPKVTSSLFKNQGGRLEAVRQILDADPQRRPMHLLGIWDNPLEVLEIARNPVLSRFVKGVDSKIFYRLALAGIFLDPAKGLLDPQTRPQQHLNFDDASPTGHVERALRWNMDCAIAWAQGEIPKELGKC
jgi:hypothetical protein